MLLASTRVNCDQGWPSQTEKSQQALWRCYNKGRSLNAAWITEPPPDISFWHCFCAHSFKQIRANHAHSRRLEKRKKKFCFWLCHKSLSHRGPTVACYHALTSCASDGGNTHSVVESVISLTATSGPQYDAPFISKRANGLFSLNWRRPTIPAVSPHPKIEAAEWESPAPRGLQYLYHRLIVLTLPEASLHSLSGSGGRGMGAKTDARQFRIHVA